MTELLYEVSWECVHWFMYAVLLLIIRLIAINLVVSKWWPIDFDSHLHLNRFHTITTELKQPRMYLNWNKCVGGPFRILIMANFLIVYALMFLHLSENYYMKGWTYCLSLCKQKQYNTKCIQLYNGNPLQSLQRLSSVSPSVRPICFQMRSWWVKAFRDYLFYESPR